MTEPQYDEESTRELARAWVAAIQEAHEAGLVLNVRTGRYVTPAQDRIINETALAMSVYRPFQGITVIT